jgi:hypothetical protein
MINFGLNTTIVLLSALLFGWLIFGNKKNRL